MEFWNRYMENLVKSLFSNKNEIGKIKVKSCQFNYQYRNRIHFWRRISKTCYSY